MREVSSVGDRWNRLRIRMLKGERRGSERLSTRGLCEQDITDTPWLSEVEIRKEFTVLIKMKNDSRGLP